MADIIFSGFGGQGVLTAGLILINAGVRAGKEVSWSPSYGSEMRGGTANCNVIISNEEVGSPYLNSCDILVAMNEPSIDKFEDSVRRGGMIVVNSSIVNKNREYRSDLRVFPVDATDMANEAQNPRGVNLVMLGVLVKSAALFDENLLEDTVKDYFGQKGKHNPQNIDCLRKGFESGLLAATAD
jgi:2-oxoacid:acceptor oxidoreductase, gamma subunit, pyruvate/2-ketoisovalerate family